MNYHDLLAASADRRLMVPTIVHRFVSIADFADWQGAVATCLEMAPIRVRLADGPPKRGMIAAGYDWFRSGNWLADALSVYAQATVGPKHEVGILALPRQADGDVHLNLFLATAGVWMALPVSIRLPRDLEKIRAVHALSWAKAAPDTLLHRMSATAVSVALDLMGCLMAPQVRSSLSQMPMEDGVTLLKLESIRG